MSVEQTSTENSVEDEVNKGMNADESANSSPDNGELWELTIKTMTSQFTVKVPPTAGVMDLKEEIAETNGIPADFQRLIFDSKIFTDNHPLTAYGVTNGSKISMVMRMRGV